MSLEDVPLGEKIGTMDIKDWRSLTVQDLGQCIASRCLLEVVASSVLAVVGYELREKWAASNLAEATDIYTSPPIYDLLIAQQLGRLVQQQWELAQESFERIMTTPEGVSFTPA